METPFLKELALHLHTTYPSAGRQLCVVMPNRRAGLYLKRYLAALQQKPVWAPSIFSIEDFIATISDLSTPDPVSLLFALYDAHQSIETDNATDFDDFVTWGKSLIRDFDEIDQYLVNATEIFGFLSESKALSLWNPENQPLTEFEEKYLRFFASLGAYYNHYTHQLLKNGQASHGLACREVATNPQHFLSNIPWTNIVFAGFNAITPAQMVIIKHLIASGKAEIQWDADEYYVNDKVQEAGRFLRNNLADKELGRHQLPGKYFASGKKQIEISGVPRSIGQTHYAGDILQQLLVNNQGRLPGETAVVLADENLLLPMLHAIPEEAGAFNITMGYPLKHTPLAVFFEQLTNLYLHASQGKTAGKVVFWHGDLKSLVHHPLMPVIAGNALTGGMMKALAASNASFLAIDDLLDENFRNHEISALFTASVTPSDLTNLLAQTVNIFRNAWLNQATANNNNQIPHAENEILFTISTIVQRMQSIVAQVSSIGQMKTIQAIFSEALASTPVPFYGEPLQGVQVMGMLETRTLDFSHVILLSANEDVLPARKSYSSFIPFEIRRHYGLPTHHDQQAVFAYHFYRLLQRCEHAWILYNTEPDGLGGGEKSRFISQLQYEMPRYNQDIRITENTPALISDLQPEQPVFIFKDETILAKISERAQKGFSPSLLATYKSCSLKFYFTYVLGLRESDETDKSIDSRTLGDIVHQTLFTLYSPLIGRIPADQQYAQMLEQADAIVWKTAQNLFPGGSLESGRNLLVMKVASDWVKRFIRTEQQINQDTHATIEVKALEQELSIIWQPEITGLSHFVTLKGTADRIDYVGQLLRITDYKTGLVEASELKIGAIEELFEHNAKKPKDKAFQLMFYLMLATGLGMAANPSAISAAILSFRALGQGYQGLTFTGKPVTEALKQFQEQLIELIHEIFNPQLAFEQTPEQTTCKNCQFKTICNR